jgi:hypothetical protein
LEDVFGLNVNGKCIRKCGICGVDILYVDQIILLPQLEQAIKSLGEVSMGYLEGGMKMICAGPDIYRLKQSERTTARDLYTEMPSLSQTQNFESKGTHYDMERRQLIRDFNLQLRNLPRNVIPN